ncbi:MAG: protein translocase subunit SecD [Chloroflexi bacterium]|nr:protein translocase subunit SecD [Chloroflexota bacterium]
MQSRYFRWLIPIVILFAIAAYLAWPTSQQLRNPFDNLSLLRDISVRQGLDLQGGLQVLLEADLPADQAVDAGAMNDTKSIIENRVNGLGVTEPIVQLSGDRRLVVELPGLADTEQALALLKQTALLEFVDTVDQRFAEGDVIQTDFAAGSTPTSTGEAAPTGQVYHTLMTGKELTSATVQTNQTAGQVVVAFELTPEGEQIFGQHTTANVGKILTIVLDKTVISSPSINGPITGGSGVITGNFTVETANQLALQLRYGSLPVPLKIAESRTVGPTLGQDSLRKSLIAGIIGLVVIAIFMIAYYRLPGVLAVLALLMYATLTFTLFKLIPVTLTLPGIAGFVLSVGVAVDANILIFERMKEELRAGRKLVTAVEEGFRRAWASIRDSNISTLITCIILFWFGSQFGASVVKGFALTLALGVVVSLFTAVLVTRTLLHAMLDNMDFSERHSWFGI